MGKFGRFFGLNSPERPEPAEEIKIEREMPSLEPGDEVSYKGNEGWYIADARNNGELFELRRSRKDPKGRDVLERDIARRSEISLPAKKEIIPPEVQPEKEAVKMVSPVEREMPSLEPGDEVSYKGSEGWYIADVKNNGELFELRRSRKDPKGRDILERDIARRSEISSTPKKEI